MAPWIVTYWLCLIPYREDLAQPSEHHQLAAKLMDELDIPYMPTLDLLDPVEDYAQPPDNHWNNSGHQKVGAYLSECVAAFIASGDLADCEHVMMP